MVQGHEENEENIIEQAGLENSKTHPVYTDWIDSTGWDKSKSEVSEEVNRRLREDQILIIQDNKNMRQNWDKNVISTDLGSKLQDVYACDEIVLSESESETESELPPLTPRRYRKAASRGSRRQPSRESKKGINYKGMFALFGEQANISEEIKYSIVESDCA